MHRVGSPFSTLCHLFGASGHQLLSALSPIANRMVVMTGYLDLQNSMDTTPPPSEMSGSCDPAQENTSPTEQSPAETSPPLPSETSPPLPSETSPPLPPSELPEPPGIAEMIEASPTV